MVSRKFHQKTNLLIKSNSFEKLKNKQIKKASRGVETQNYKRDCGVVSSIPT